MSSSAPAPDMAALEIKKAAVITVLKIAFIGLSPVIPGRTSLWRYSSVCFPLTPEPDDIQVGETRDRFRHDKRCYHFVTQQSWNCNISGYEWEAILCSCLAPF